MQNDIIIRPLRLQDNSAIAAVIRQVSAEYGLTPDRGFGVADKTLDNLFDVYTQAHSRYWIVEIDGKVVGGAGIAPLAGKPNIAELQKMYFLPEARGKGVAKQMFTLLHEFAQSQPFELLYLETTAVLVEALNLYQSLGFSSCCHLGETGHDACEIAMSMPL